MAEEEYKPKRRGNGKVKISIPGLTFIHNELLEEKRASWSRPKVIGYCRTSTNDQEGSITDQENLIIDYCIKKGLELIHMYKEEGCSGEITSMERPFAKQMMLQIANGEAASVIVAKQDRFTRNATDYINTLNVFGKHGAELICLDMEWVNTTTDDGVMTASIMTIFAERERKKIAQRTLDAHRQKKNRGEVVGAIPYGYSSREVFCPTANRKLKVLVENKEEQETIQMAKIWRAVQVPYVIKKGTRPMPIVEICAKLNAAGKKTRKGVEWTVENARYLLLMAKKRKVSDLVKGDEEE